MKNFLATLALIVAGTGGATAEVYECDMKRGASGGWISPTIFVNVQAAHQKVAVIDAFTLDITDDWYPAKLSVDNKKRYSLSWSTGRQKDRSGQNTPGFSVRMTILKGDKTARVSAQPKGYEDFFTTSGKCKIVEN